MRFRTSRDGSWLRGWDWAGCYGFGIGYGVTGLGWVLIGLDGTRDGFECPSLVIGSQTVSMVHFIIPSPCLTCIESLVVLPRCRYSFLP